MQKFVKDKMKCKTTATQPTLAGEGAFGEEYMFSFRVQRIKPSVEE